VMSISARHRALGFAAHPVAATSSASLSVSPSPPHISRLVRSGTHCGYPIPLLAPHSRRVTSCCMLIRLSITLTRRTLHPRPSTSPCTSLPHLSPPSFFISHLPNAASASSISLIANSLSLASVLCRRHFDVSSGSESVPSHMLV
jgi:hypothetical protein